MIFLSWAKFLEKKRGKKKSRHVAEFYRLILFRFFNRERGLASPEMEMAGSGGSDVRWCGDLRQRKLSGRGRGSRGESPEHDVGSWFALRWLLDVAGVGRNSGRKRTTKNSCSGCEFSKENRVHKMRNIEIWRMEELECLLNLELAGNFHKQPRCQATPASNLRRWAGVYAPKGEGFERGDYGRRPKLI